MVGRTEIDKAYKYKTVSGMYVTSADKYVSFTKK